MNQIPAADGPGKLNRVHQDIAAQVARYSRFIISRGVPVDQDDLEQESWRVCLQVADKYDPDAPGATGWFMTILRRRVGETIFRWGCPVSVPNLVAGAGDQSIRGAPMLPGMVEMLSGQPPTPEELCSARELEMMACERRRQLSARARAVGEMAAGMPAYGARPRIAAALGITDRQVRSALQVYRRVMSDPGEPAQLSLEMGDDEMEMQT